jgi:hypothetical protein
MRAESGIFEKGRALYLLLILPLLYVPRLRATSGTFQNLLAY